jgi:glycosyltransferase involved in cell wall biosynthesis
MSVEKTPRVSIGLPIYNGEAYVRLAIESLLAQTYTDFELILTDNASTDATEAICREYAAKDARIRYHRMEKNIGGAANHNYTIDTARGEYFKWGAYDDLCEPTFLEKCVEVLDQQPDVVLAYAQVVHIDAEGKVIENYDSGFHLVAENPVERLRKFFKAPVKCSPIYGVMRLAMLRETPRLGAYAAADRILLGEIALRGKIYEVPERLFLRRMHPEMSTERAKTLRDLANWYDPKNWQKLQLPLWKWLFEYWRAVERVPLTARQRSSARKVVIQEMLRPRRWPAMAKEILRALLQLPLVVAAKARAAEHENNQELTKQRGTLGLQ